MMLRDDCRPYPLAHPDSQASSTSTISTQQSQAASLDGRLGEHATIQQWHRPERQNDRSSRDHFAYFDRLWPEWKRNIAQRAVLDSVPKVVFAPEPSRGAGRLGPQASVDVAIVDRCAHGVDRNSRYEASEEEPGDYGLRVRARAPAAVRYRHNQS